MTSCLCEIAVWSVIWQESIALTRGLVAARSQIYIQGSLNYNKSAHARFNPMIRPGSHSRIYAHTREVQDILDLKRLYRLC